MAYRKGYDPNNAAADNATAAEAAAPQPQEAEAVPPDLKARLDDLNRAAQREPPPPPQAPPEIVQKWATDHPDYYSDQEKNLRLQLAEIQAVKAGFKIDQPGFIEAVEQNLGIRPHVPAAESAATAADLPTANGGAEGRSVPIRSAVPPPSRPQPAYRGGSASAPPSREAPSYATGRAVDYGNTRLTNEQAEAARISGVSVEEYRKQLARMNELKRQGVIQDGR